MKRNTWATTAVAIAWAGLTLGRLAVGLLALFLALCAIVSLLATVMIGAGLIQ